MAVMDHALHSVCVLAELLDVCMQLTKLAIRHILMTH